VVAWILAEAATVTLAALRITTTTLAAFTRFRLCWYTTAWAPASVRLLCYLRPLC